MDKSNWQKRAKTFRQVKYGSPSTEWTKGLQHRLDLAKNHIEFSNKKVLDIGCGVGMFLNQFRKLKSEVFGVDVDKHKIDIAKKRYKNVQVAPAEKLPFRKDTYDIVWLHEVIEHVEDDKKVIDEAFRVLKPGGKLVIFAPNKLWPFETHGIFWHDKYHFGNIPLATYLPDSVYKEMTPHVRSYSKKDLFKLFERITYKVTHYQGVFPGFDKISYKVPVIGKLIVKVFRILEGTFLNMFGLSHFVVVEKGRS
ncbi:class I SAM-dependent methyltransferase [Patescibacteria group bacterium]